jgi:hypothetical protein
LFLAFIFVVLFVFILTSSREVIAGRPVYLKESADEATLNGDSPARNFGKNLPKSETGNGKAYAFAGHRLQ